MNEDAYTDAVVERLSRTFDRRIDKRKLQKRLKIALISYRDFVEDELLEGRTKIAVLRTARELEIVTNRLSKILTRRVGDLNLAQLIAFYACFANAPAIEGKAQTADELMLGYLCGDHYCLMFDRIAAEQAAKQLDLFSKKARRWFHLAKSARKHKQYSDVRKHWWGDGEWALRSWILELIFIYSDFAKRLPTHPSRRVFSDLNTGGATFLFVKAAVGAVLGAECPSDGQLRGHIERLIRRKSGELLVRVTTKR